MKSTKSKAGPVARQTKNVSRTTPGTAVTFVSRGSSGTSGDFANKTISLSDDGNPFYTDLNSRYGSAVVPIDLQRFFAPALFSAYEYYRIVKCETSFEWLVMPVSAVNGAMMYALDRDSNGSINEQDVINRRDNQVRYFNNDKLVHTVVWKPFLTAYNDISGTSNQTPWVVEQNKWLNTSQIETMRHGTLRCLFWALGGSRYTNTPAVGIRHRITIEMKGLLSIVPPQIPNTVNVRAIEKPGRKERKQSNASVVSALSTNSKF